VRRALLAASLLAALALAALAAGRPAQDGSGSVFSGLATWVDIYDGGVYADPEGTAARIAARGVRTVFAETANYRVPADVVKPLQLGRLVEALHARGVSVVAWYLPGFDRPARDLRRTLAMVRFRTPAGEGFDAVALDVEATVVRDAGLRSRRLLVLARRLRAEAGTLPVAAVVLPPRMLERRPTVWPRFPWAELAGVVDAFVPMLYTGTAFRGYEATYGYVARSLRLLRAAVGPGHEVHAAGGVADRLQADELTAFVDAVADDGSVGGWSLYDWETTPASAWRPLARLR
jgi:hypothetical protein